MTTTRQQLLGWIEHCEREHPDKGTSIPTWLCSFAAVTEAEYDGDITVIGRESIVPRLGISATVYGLTEKGRAKFYSNLPQAGKDSS